MKVKEALEIFGIEIAKLKQWKCIDNKWGYYQTDEIGIINEYGESLSTDRNLLISNLDSEVSYLKHIGMVGLLGFKMRNGQYTLFGFNNPLDERNINRCNTNHIVNNYKKFEEMSKQKQHDIDDGNIGIWLSLKVLGGK